MRQVTEKDRKHLLDVTKSMQDEKFEFFDKLPSGKIKQMTNMFKDMTSEDLEAVLNKKKEKKEVEQDDKDKRTEIFREFKEKKELINKLIQNID